MRLVLRATLLAAVTGALWAAWLLGALPALVLARSGAWRASVLHAWARAVARVIALRAVVHGGLGREPCLLVANHLSYLDVVLLGALRPCVFVAKREVAAWPVVGLLARSMGTLFVERERKRGLPQLARELGTALAAGRTVVLFPEGTSTAGGSLRAFHPALLAPAAELGVPVRSAALRYRTPSGAPPAELAVCWWGEMTFVRHLCELLRLPFVEADVFLGIEALLDTDRKRLARRLHQEVSARLALAGGAARA